jgi:hypothetical protein
VVTDELDQLRGDLAHGLLHSILAPSAPATLHWNWMPRTWVDVTQATVWLVLCAALAVWVARGSMALLDRRRARLQLLLIGAVALGARLLVPWVPVNWYSGVNNVDLGTWVFSRDTTSMPLPNQLFTFTLGFEGIVGFNIFIGVVSCLLAWHVTRQAGYGERVSFVFGLAMALTPMYVRLSASDSSHLLALPLWWLAALALLWLIRGVGGRVDQLILFCTAAAACPIRIEAGLTMPAVAFFVATNRQGLRDVWRARGRWWPLVAGLLLGFACSFAAHWHSWQIRVGSFSLPLFLLEMVASVLFLVDLHPLGLLSPIYTLLIWYYVGHTVRRRDFDEAAATVCPFVLFAIPYAYTAKGMLAVGANLPGAAYATTIAVFVLLGGAKGAVLLYDRLEPLGSSVRRVLATSAVSVILLGWILVPYRTTYAYMEELSFLSSNLPREKVTLLTIFDPSGPGDYDCCLALPYPTFAGDFPKLEWHVLGHSDADEERLRGLEFDYYYPGTLPAVDVENLNTWFIGRLFPDREMNAQQQAQLRQLQSIDQFIRKTYPLEPYRQATLPAQTFSWAPFRDDRMTLTIYRRKNRIDAAS